MTYDTPAYHAYVPTPSLPDGATTMTTDEAELKLTRSELAKRLLDSDSENDANYDLEQAFLELLDEADRRLSEAEDGEAYPVNTFLVLARRFGGDEALHLRVRNYGLDSARAWINEVREE